MKQKRFNSLTSNGPTFPEEYQSKGLVLNGEKLPVLAEEMLWKAARFIGSDYETEAFAKNGNMWKCLKPELTKTQQKLQFPADFLDILNVMKNRQESEKLEKKATPKEVKLAEKAEKEKIKEIFGTAILDGKKVRLANFAIEAPNWILTRGKDPRKFCWKYAVTESDVTLNIVNATNPTKLKSVSDATAMWVMKYQIHCGRPEMSCYKKLNKVIAFHGEVSVRQEAITGKFDTSAKILKNWTKIQTAIRTDALKGKDEALVIYLIQETGIRVGGEKDEKKSALTYGMSTLRGEHMILGNGNTITFNFLGKDSVPETRTITIDAGIWNVLKKKTFTKGKRIFAEDINVNGYLKSIMPGITVKNLRTVKCNEVLVNNLKAQKITANNTEAEKLRAIFEANLEIAKQMNHQKNVGKNQKEAEGKIEERVTKAKARVKELKKKHKEKIAKLEIQKEKFKVAFKGMKILKEKLALIEEQKIKLTAQMEKAKTAIEKTELALDKKKLTKDIALGTSLANYADFRILKSYCDEIALPMEKIFTATQMVAIGKLVENTPANFWRNYPS